MRRVTVRYFAAYREAVGAESESFETTAATVGELFAEACEQHPGLRALPRSLVAVDDTMVRWEAPLEDGVEVLFFPPVAGG
jgi:molybdopterin synthase sulfur carrier subunit